MKMNVAAIVLIISVSVLSGYAQTDKPFVSKDGRFSVIPPVGFEKPKHEKTTMSSDVGDFVINKYSFDLERGSCLISYYDYPERLFQAKSVDKILSDALAGATENAGITVLKQENTPVDGYPAAAFDFRRSIGKDLFYGRSVLVIAKPRVYSYIYVTADRSQLAKPDVLNFFKSFHIQK